MIRAVAEQFRYRKKNCILETGQNRLDEELK